MQNDKPMSEDEQLTQRLLAIGAEDRCCLMSGRLNRLASALETMTKMVNDDCECGSYSEYFSTVRAVVLELAKAAASAEDTSIQKLREFRHGC